MKISKFFYKNEYFMLKRPFLIEEITSVRENINI